MAPNNIKEIRADRGMTQQQLADRLHTSQAHVDRLEKGNTRLTIDWMRRLAVALECGMWELSSEFALRPDQEALLKIYEGLAEPEREAFRHVGSAMAQRPGGKTGTGEGG